MDPWWSNPSNGTQPGNHWETINPQTDQYQVFLNQGQINNPNSTDPIYSIKASSVGLVTPNDIYVFDRWSGSNIDFGGGTTTTNNRITDVVFLQPGASITAYYVSAITEGRTVTVDNGETLTLPAGGIYQLNNAISIHVESSGKLIIDGTAQNPVTITGSGIDNSWPYATLDDYQSNYYDPYEISALINLTIGESIPPYEPNLVISNAIIKDAPYAIKIFDDIGNLGYYNHERAVFDNLTIENVNIGITLGMKGRVTINNSKISNTNIGFYIWEGPGDYRGNILIIENNDCGFAVPYIQGPTGSFATPTFHLNNCTFYNNQFYDLLMGGDLCTDCDIFGTGYFIRNSIFAYSGGFSNYPVADYNFVYEIEYDGIWAGDGNIVDTEGPPDFVDAPNGDFHLRSSSPCIDAGDPDPQYNDPDGTRNDMGAFYYDAVPSPPQNLDSQLITENIPCQNCHETNVAIKLSWDENVEPHISYYILYRSESQNDCSKCHDDGESSELENTRSPETTDDPFLLGKDCPNLSGEQINLSRNIMEVETGCQSGIDETRSILFTPLWAWDYNYWYDLEILQNYTYVYYVAAVDLLEQESGPSNFTLKYVPEGFGGRAKILIGDIIPKVFFLYPNFPNPFNPITEIRYQVPKPSHVVIEIFNIRGQKITTLVDDEKPAGYYKIIWDVSDTKGLSVPSGMYIYKITAISLENKIQFTASRKMVLLK